uniref:Uncharacterized protein n=1 Tax=Anguilla anguilla TaxID=7936 RepID=A0A0E9XNW0_ANGAN
MHLSLVDIATATHPEPRGKGKTL